MSGLAGLQRDVVVVPESRSNEVAALVFQYQTIEEGDHIRAVAQGDFEAAFALHVRLCITEVLRKTGRNEEEAFRPGQHSC